MEGSYVSNYDLIPFGSQVTGDGEVTAIRITKELVQGCKRVSARDVISVVSMKDRNESSQTWRRIFDKYPSDFEPFLVDVKFQGKGQQFQPSLSLQGVFKLLMLLPGERAKLFRGTIASTLVKHMAENKGMLSPDIKLDPAQRVLLHEMAQSEVKYQSQSNFQSSVNDEDDKIDENTGLALVPFVGEFDLLSARWEAEDQEAIESATDTHVFGYCYLAWNPSLSKKLFKIGATLRPPILRIQELSRTSVPVPFQLIASFQCFEPFQTEKRIHAHFTSSRKYGRRKEFFDAPRHEILAFFDRMAMESLYNMSTSSKPVSRPKKRTRPDETVVMLREEMMALREQMVAQSKIMEKLAVARP